MTLDPKIKSAAARHRGFIFTHNNYPDTGTEDAVDCQYMLYGKEVGTSGTPHLQGYVYYATMKSEKQVRADLPGCHVEPAVTVEAAIAYCKKDGDWSERGTPPSTSKARNAKGGQAEKDKWDAARLAAEESRDEDIPPDIRFKHYKAVEHFRKVGSLKRSLSDSESQMLWYYGPSGTGKSRKARSENPSAYLKMCNKWWDGYDGEDCVLIEDFDTSHKCLVHHLKLWADRYPFLAEMKGTALKIRPSLILVTSNYHPSEIWDSKGDLEPILRRFKCVRFPPGLVPAAAADLATRSS
jgi:hypothetical protein